MRFLLILLLWILTLPVEASEAYRGTQFIAVTNFSGFGVTEDNDSLLFRSKPIPSAVNWNELILSWNYTGQNEKGLEFQVKVHYPNHATKWYSLGKWANQPYPFPRESLKNQRDEDGNVLTDTLRMVRHGGEVEVKVTFKGKEASIEDLKLLGLSFTDTTAAPGTLPPQKNVWGKVLQVKERTQADYPEGISSWCSPTTTSMLLSFWSAKLQQPELDYDVPEVAKGVNDPNWPGTGNWSFNMAFAGSHEGIRAYVTRFSDVSELEAWIGQGIPVGISVSYGLLKGETEKGNGHLVVCIGFTSKGDIVVNDPGRRQVRQIYKREDLVRAWAESEKTVYLVYPVGAEVPKDRFGHWLGTIRY